MGTYKREPFLIWITGYPGAGKTTIAKALKEKLRKEGEVVVLIDGDEFREIFSQDLGYSPEDRIKNAWRIARLAYFLNKQGVNVITATVSMYREVRGWLRKNSRGYREVYVEVSKETLLKRNQKSLYTKAVKGEVSNIPGVDLKVDEPENPHLVINNDGAVMPLERCVEKIETLINSPFACSFR